jgi:predicted RNA-binding Zn ribbon-like protein
MQKNPVLDELRLDGGVLCLDFVNTVPDRKDGTQRDHLGHFNDLLYWARKAKAVDSSVFSSLEEVAAKNEKKANGFLAEAIEIRSLIYSLFKPISQQQKVKAADLEAFNAVMARYFPFLEISLTREGFAEEWNLERHHFFWITAPIVKSAHDLLLSDKLSRVKECPNCGWLFLDSTKNGKRRWCSMQDCGSNVKALEYYYRKKMEK